MDGPTPRDRASRGIRVACLVVLALSISRTASTDGCYFPERAYKKLPSIPLQRALLKFKDGVEKLVIESALDAEGQSFGWIIPIPAKPTAMGKSTPGLLKTLSGAMQPSITHDVSRGVTSRIWLVVAVGVWLVTVLAWAPRSRLVPIGLLLAVPLFMMLIPPLAGRSKMTASASDSRGPGIEGVRIEAAARIGNYEVTVLSADSASALGEWLSANAFADLPEKGVPIVEDYIKKGWCFVAAKLATDGSGRALPHPIALTFDSEEPVYPMRLTALADSTVYLEVFVVADGRAHCPGLPLECSDTYEHRPGHRMTHRSGKPIPGYVGKKHWQVIGHPAVMNDLWDGCVISKFAGELGPSDMDADLVFELLPAKPYRKHLYSSRGARDIGFIWTAMLLCLALPAAIIVLYRRLTRPGGRVFMLTRVVGPALGGSLLLWGLVYALLPKTEVRTSRHWKKGPPPQISVSYHSAVRGVLKSDRAVATGTPEYAAKAFGEYFRYRCSVNSHGGGRVRVEDSPGNYTIHTDDGGLALRTYDRHGFPWDYPFEDQPGPSTSPSTIARTLAIHEEVLQKNLRSAINSQRIDAAGALARLGREEGYEVLEREVAVRSLRPRHHDYTPIQKLLSVGTPRAARFLLDLLEREHGQYYYDTIIRGLRLRYPRHVAPVVLRHLKEALADGSVGRPVFRDLDLLGPIIREEPPINLKDKSALDRFVKAAEAWCAAHPSE